MFPGNNSVWFLQTSFPLHVKAVPVKGFAVLCLWSFTPSPLFLALQNMGCSSTGWFALFCSLLYMYDLLPLDMSVNYTVLRSLFAFDYFRWSSLVFFHFCWCFWVTRSNCSIGGLLSMYVIEFSRENITLLCMFFHSLVFSSLFF